ncbi:membrane-associated, eicosanoid/glutathione metabolism protein [Aspergillus unguis]
MSYHIPGLLQPVLALNGWTLIIEGWMFATRLPVYSRIKEALNPATPRAQIDEQTPASVRYKSDNYSHLFEQPVQFYAVALALAIARHGEDNPLDMQLAWSYVGLRVVHSLVHCTGSSVMARFGLFLTSSAVLGAMTVRGALLAF